MVTISILAILLTIAIPNLRSFIVNAELRGAISTLQTDAMNARAEAIRLVKPVVVRPIDPTAGWTSGWQVVTLDVSGADSTVLFSRDSLSPSIAVAKDTLKPSVIRYDSAGFGRESNGAFLAGCVLLSAPYTKRESAIIFDAAGRPRICSGVDPSGCCT